LANLAAVFGAVLLAVASGCDGEPAPTTENPFAGSGPGTRSAPPPPSIRSGRLARGAPPPVVRRSTSANGSEVAANGDPADPANPGDSGSETPESQPQFPEQDRAIAEATRQIAESPFTTHISYNNRAVAYFEKGEVELALADLNKAIELKSDYGEAWHNRGVVHEALGERDKARMDFAQAKRLNAATRPDTPE
jgi:hypothetical protein